MLRSALTLLLLVGPLACQTPTVGERGGLDHVAVRGAEPHVANRILITAAAMPDSLSLGAADAARGPWLEFLDQACRRALDSMGHLVSSAEVAWNEEHQRPEITVVQGPLCRWRDVRVVGADDPQPLRAALPIETGSTADLTPTRREWIDSAVRSVFRTSGRLDPAFEIAFPVDDDGATDIVVTVDDPGPPARITALELRGETDDAFASILKQRLMFARDEPFTEQLEKRLGAELDSACRYAGFHFEPGQRADDGAMILRIDLVPATFGLPLDEPLPDQIAALAKGLQHLLDTTPTDLSLRGRVSIQDSVLDGWRASGASLSLSPASALLEIADLERAGNPLGDLHICLSGDRIVAAMPDQGWRSQFAVQVHTNFRVMSRGNPREPSMCNFAWNFGFQLRQEGGSRFELELDVAPLVIAKLLHEHAIDVTPSDAGFLISRHGQPPFLEVDGESGVLRALDSLELEQAGDSIALEFGIEPVDETLRALEASWDAAQVRQLAPFELLRNLCRTAVADAAARSAPAWGLLTVAADHAVQLPREAQDRLLTTVVRTATELTASPSRVFEQTTALPFDSWLELLVRMRCRVELARTPAIAIAALEDHVARWGEAPRSALAAWVGAELTSSIGNGNLSRRTAAYHADGTNWAAIQPDVRAVITEGCPLHERITELGTLWLESQTSRKILGADADSVSRFDAGLAGIGIIWDGLLRSLLEARLGALRRG